MNLSPITRVLGRSLLQARKQSPHIFFSAGVVGVVTSTVLACRATLKLNDTLDDIQKDISNVKGIHEADVAVKEGVYPNYPTEQYSKDLVYVYAKAGLEITKLYGPSIVIGVTSVALLTTSHVQMHKRNQALMAAYAALHSAFGEYRERVREALGEDKEKDIFHGTKTEIMQNEVGDKEEVKTFDTNKYSPYAKFFDEYSDYWEKDPEQNRLYLQCQQNFANNLLHARGHIFLNEVYDMLGINRSKAGAVVGWVVGKDGDNFVDFGIYEAFNVAFVNGWERSILLDFNVDGVIYDKI